MAVSNPEFAIAAAHNITPRAIKTWYPPLPRSVRVMVPVHVEALAVRSEGGTWGDCRFKPPSNEAPENPSRLDLLTEPFKNLSKRAKGIYLHWALPDGLTRGTANPDLSDASFMAIPDRWLVLRLYPGSNAARRNVRGWVLRAGDETPLVVDLDSWIEDGKTHGNFANPLTALGYGDLAWAAYFDNVRNRLSFYDDLADAPVGPLAYVVCGWYSNPALDPLGSETHSLADFHSRMLELGWELANGELHESVGKVKDYLQAASAIGLKTMEAFNTGVPADPSGASARLAVPIIQGAGSLQSALDDSGRPVDGAYNTDGSWWPKLTVYHGAVVGIGWPGVGFPGSENGLLAGEVGGPPSPSDIKIAVGNTLTEAISAMVAKTNNSPDQARVLEAFMLGALNELDEGDGTARIDARLHASAFGSLPGGTVDEEIVETTATTPTLPANPGNRDPGIFKRQFEFVPQVEVVQQRTIRDVVAQVNTFNVAERISESHITPGGLADAFAGITPEPLPTSTPPKKVTVKRSLPRKYVPTDPVILLQGAKRSYKHGYDDRFTADGRPICRLTGHAIYELSCASIGEEQGRIAVRGDDVLQRGVENGSVPPECEELLREAALLDPGTATVAANATSAVSGPPVAAKTQLNQVQNFMVEQTAWWVTRDSRVDHGPLIAHSGLAGILPSPIAISPPLKPWTPLHIDWEVQFLPSPNDAKDWTLDEIDYKPRVESMPGVNDTKSGIILTGRALLTAGPAATIAAGVRKALEQAQAAGGASTLSPGVVSRFNSTLAQTLLGNLSALKISPVAGAVADGTSPTIDRSSLADIASSLENMDVLAGAFDSFHTRLRGGLEGDGVTTQEKDATSLPTPFVAMRAGFLRILRLRLVDCFGQVVDLAGSGEGVIADPNQLIKSEPVEVKNRIDITAVPPRFTSPTRLSFRFIDASGGDREANPDISPICGYLLPNHLDSDLDFYDADGNNLGEVRLEPGAGIVWEDALGRPSTVGQSPARAVPNSFLAGIAQGLIDWGVADASLGESAREDALSAILRIVDSTFWSIDPFGHTGDEHLALLIGHPMAVLRARLRLEVEEPVDATRINVMKIAMRLGALTHWQDGLLGYFVNDDYRTLYCADAAVAGFAREVGPRRGFLQPINLVPSFYERFAADLGADASTAAPVSPVNHPYVSDAGVLQIVPNQDVMLTLLVEPHCVVHATAGVVPRKEIGMRREWVSGALAKIAPTFRFGPVLVDPKRIRLPLTNELNGSWSWNHRTDITTWADEPVINATQDSLLQPDPAKGQEGWLKLTFKEGQ